MELTSGKIYKSPFYARQIKVSSIMDNGESYTLVVLWIEQDLDYDEMDEITVSKDDVKQWKLVN